MKKPVVLMILDGYGLSNETEGNAIAMAKTPVMDKLMAEYPWQPGNASGLFVGLPDGQMGNSEVGHMNMGGGRIIYQDLTLITKYIEDGVFFKNEELLKAINNCKENNSDLHLWGLLSDGGVHSHITHLYALLEMCKREGLERVYLHPFFDGRDTPPASGKGYLEALVAKTKEIGVGTVASLSGRYYAMDRDNNYDRIQIAYDSLVLGEGVKATDPIKAMQDSYDEGVTDEFVKPTVIVKEDGTPVSVVKPNDSVIFFNFRPDRAREITRAFCFKDEDIAKADGTAEDSKSIKSLKRANGYMPLVYVCFKDYDEAIPNKYVAFKKVEITNTFGDYLANKGLKQLRIAETEKYAHVTFFFDGGLELDHEGKDKILINSPAVATYDLQPEMSAPLVLEALIKELDKDYLDVVILNFANCDMVGHTAVEKAVVKAVETVDACVGKIIEWCDKNGGTLLVTADHGNAEEILDDNNKPFTAHTTNVVPFCINRPELKLKPSEGKLADIAPTIIELLGREKPVEMSGESLIVK